MNRDVFLIERCAHDRAFHTKRFGAKTISLEAIDRKIDEEERRIMKRRVRCNKCFVLKSTNGSCNCD